MTLKKKQLIYKLNIFTNRNLSVASTESTESTATSQVTILTPPVKYTYKQLDAKTVVALRALARDHQPRIPLNSATTKKAIISIILDYYAQESGAASTNVITVEPPSMVHGFPVSTNSRGFINVTPWFANETRSAQALNRALTNDKFNHKVECYCADYGVEKSDVLNKVGGQLFLPRTLAVLLAIDLNPRFGLYLADFFLEGRPSKIEKHYISELQKMGVRLLDAGLSARFNVGWPDMDTPFGIYWLVVGDLVKVGCVGLKANSDKHTLNRRLATHRSTYCSLVLVNVIVFNDSDSVQIFDKFQKLALQQYSVGQEEYLEQYKQTPEFISKILLHCFSLFEDSNVCHMCDELLISSYNAEAKCGAQELPKPAKSGDEVI